MAFLGTEYIRLDGTKLVCKRKEGKRCVEYRQAKDGKCITKSPKHPTKTKARARKTTRKKPPPKRVAAKRKAPPTRIIMPKKKPPFWEMTYKEFFEHAGSEFTAGERFGLPTHNRIPVIPGTRSKESGALPEGRIRRAVVRKAILDGKKIPDHVMKDYPALAEVKPIKPEHRAEYDMALVLVSLSAKTDKRFDQIVDEAGIGADKTGNALESLRQLRKVDERPYHSYRRTSGSISGVNLAGDLLTCSKWQIRTKNGTEYVRCAEYEKTCSPEAKPAKPAPSPARKAARKFGVGDRVEITQGFKKGKQGRVVGSDESGYSVILDNREAPLHFDMNEVKRSRKPAPSPAKKQAPHESSLWNLKRGDLWKMTRADFVKLFGDVYVTTTKWIPIDEISGREFEKRHGTEALFVEPAKQRYVDQFVKMLEEGKEPPPIKVFGKVKESDKYDLYDGHRRVLAALETGKKTINAEVTMVDENGRSLSHQMIIADAIAQGEEIPAAVMKDYPELKKLLPEPPPKPTEVKKPVPVTEAKYKAPAPGPHLKDAPFTKEQTEQYNRYTHFPQDFNKQFGESVRAMETAVKQNLDDHDMKELPRRLDNALQWYRKQLYDYHLVRFRSQSYAPPPMVVGPAKYPIHRLEKAEARDKKAYAKVEKAKAYVERAEREATKGKVSQEREGDVVDVALHMRKVAFGKWYLENEKKKLKDDDSGYAQQIRRGSFAAPIRKKGRTLHEKIVRQAVAEGKQVIAEVVSEYPDLRAAAGIRSNEEILFNIGAEGADQAFKKEHEGAKSSPIYDRAAAGVYYTVIKKNPRFGVNEKGIFDLWEFAFRELKDPLTLQSALKGMNAEIKDIIHAGNHLDNRKRLEAVAWEKSINWPERIRLATDAQDAKGRLYQITEGRGFGPSPMKRIEDDITWALKHALRLKAMAKTLKTLDRYNKNIVDANTQVTELVVLANKAAGVKRKQYEEAKKIAEGFKGLGLLLVAGKGYNRLPIPPAFRM